MVRQLLVLGLVLGFTIDAVAFEQQESQRVLSPGITAQSQRLPQNFGQVDQGLYRSAAPANREQLAFLASQGIKTVIDLRQDHEKQIPEGAILKGLGVQYLAYPMHALSKNDTQYVLGILEKVSDHKNWPLLVHCRHGKDRTGLIIGLYRVLKNDPPKDPNDAWKEMLSYGYFTLFRNLTRTFKDVTGWRPSER